MARIAIAAAVLVAALGRVQASAGQTPPEITVTQRAALERIALARARAGLWEQLGSVALAGELRIGGWAARDLGRDRALRLWAREQTAAGPARIFSDGICEVDVRVEPSALAEALNRARAASLRPAQDLPDGAAIGQAARGWPVFWATGRAVRDELDGGEKPVGWEDVSFEGIEIARRAATADALRALLDTASRMKVTNALRLEQFLDAAPEVRAAVQASLAQAAQTGITLAADQVAVAEAAIELTELIRILTEVRQTHYQGEQFQASDFREMALIAEQRRVAATGLATPPSDSVLKSPYRLIELDAPAWATQTLTTKGVHDPVDGEQLDRDAQIDAARLRGIDGLRTQVEALVVQGDVTVEELLEFAPFLKDDVVLFLTSARAVGAARGSDGGVELPLELPLGRLWEILGRAMETIEVDDVRAALASQPASAPTTATTAPTTAAVASPAPLPTTQPLDQAPVTLPASQPAP